MSNAIEREIELSKAKMIEEVICDGINLAKLTVDNVAIVEAMIRNDSAYIKSTKVDACPNRNGYRGSSAFWMTELKKILIDDVPSDFSYEDIIRSAVESVDRENSTHINADNAGRRVITSRILSYGREELIRGLKFPEETQFHLLSDIAAKTSAARGARINPSFASKFCHYACFYLFEGTEYQDNYSIYDNILKTVLPYYLKFYGIKRHYTLTKYQDYRAAIDSIRSAAGNAISRNGFDHLLWYYHKGRIEAY